MVIKAYSYVPCNNDVLFSYLFAVASEFLFGHCSFHTTLSYTSTTSNCVSVRNGKSCYITVTCFFASCTDKTVAQVAIRWLLQQKVVSSVVIGVTSLQQLEDNMGAAAGWQLSDKEVKHNNLFKSVYNDLSATFIS